MEESGSMIPGKARLLSHAQDYRDRAKLLTKTQPSWITDGIEVRTAEYLHLANYFEKLAGRDDNTVIRGWDFSAQEPIMVEVPVARQIEGYTVFGTADRIE